jgi:uncharacterized phage protein (TIGR02218 family)
MRLIPTELAAHVAGGATTLCHCWRLLRRDGVVLGFTDHDEDLIFGGTLFAARAGFETAEAEAQLGFAVGGSEVSGALVSDLLREDDLSAGRYDGASVEAWLVNWADPTQRLLQDVTTIGEVRRGEFGFTAELRSMASLLDREVGRLYQATCSADLGDAKCRADLDGPSFRTTRSVLSSDGSTIVTVALQDFADGWFTAGTLRVLSGANQGTEVAIKEHRAAAAGHVLSLWTALTKPISAGDSVQLTAGCNKSLATCRDKFGNVLNFRGCPHMPGNDIVASYASSALAMDGGSLFR